ETGHYKTRLSMDIAQSSVTYDPVIGTSGGIQFLFSDMLGNTQYYCLIGNTARTKDEILKNFNLGFTYVNLKSRLNYGFGAYHLADYYSYGYSYDETYFERKYGVLGLISYPLNRFERLEFSCYLKNATRDWYQQYIFDKALLGEQIVSYVIDRSMWGVVAPLDGYRVRLTLGLSENVTERRMHYLLLLLDARYYYRLAYQSCWASRIQLGYSSGQQPHLFWLGGSWSLRGYDHFDFIGRKLIQFNNELRFPFIQYIGIFTPLAALSFNQIEGALFMDVGNAWSDQFDHFYGDFGMGMRLNLWNALCLRLDFAKTTDFKRISHATKIQFFFGWSY
nr:BamA/TamA family outer membrane protein [Candidatus Delongbacteria bacterium]